VRGTSRLDLDKWLTECTAAKARLINHLVGGGEQRRRHIKPE
jgi:hypothetical protein